MHLTQPSPEILPLFSQSHLAFMVEAMLAGNSPALAWRDAETALIWDKAYCIYLGGKLENPRLREVISAALLPLAQQIRAFKISLTHDDQAAFIPNLFPEFGNDPYPHRLFKLDSAAVTTTPIVPPDGFHIRLIDAELLADTQRPGHADLAEEIELCWVARDRFLEYGFGVCLLDNTGAIVCRCTAEYVSSQTCGIGIATHEAVMGRGLATTAARVFVQKAMREGWTVYWDSRTNNLPSMRVAEKVGFKPITDYTPVIIYREA